jgi:hypothetical protein
MIVYAKEELYEMFKSAVDRYFQLERDYDFLKAQRDRLYKECKELKQENVALKRTLEINCE